MKKFNKKPAVIVLNVVAVLFGIYALITMYSSYTYISELVGQGLIIKDEILNIVNYYVTNSAPYIFYAIATWGIGNMISKINNLSEKLIVEEKEIENEEFKAVEELVAAEIIEEIIEEEVEEVEEDNIEI